MQLIQGSFKKQQEEVKLQAFSEWYKAQNKSPTSHTGQTHLP